MDVKRMDCRNAQISRVFGSQGFWIAGFLDRRVFWSWTLSSKHGYNAWGIICFFFDSLSGNQVHSPMVAG